MSESLKGAVGVQSQGDGAIVTPRAGHSGELVVLPHGKWYEAALRGRLFHGQTAVTGVAPGTAVGTTAAFALANPASSGVDLVVLKAWLSYVSGTLGIGQIDWVGHLNPAQAAITGTAIAPVNGKVGGGAGQGKPLTTATVPAAGSVFRLFANLPPMLASSVNIPWRFEDNVDGAIVIPPGVAVSLQATAAAGTSPLVLFGVMWEEVPVRS